MKRISIIVTILLLLLSVLACNTGITFGTPTTVADVTNTPTAVSATATPVDITTLPTVSPSNTPTQEPTATSIPVTSVPTGCSTIPCGPNLFFNSGLDVRTDWNATKGNIYPYVLHQQFPDIPNILVPEFWNFEYKLGTNDRNPSDPYCGQFQTPEAGNAMRDNTDWSYRVDGYNPVTNPEAFRWFKSWSCLNAGPTQVVPLLEGHTYQVGFAVSAWSTLEGDPTGNLSILGSPEDKSNIEFVIRYNLDGGSVFDGKASRPFGYDDGVYDYTVDQNGVAHYNGHISMKFTVPYDSDAGNTTNVNVGLTGSSRFAYGIVDYQADNAYLYCMDCSYGPVVTNPNPTATQEVYIHAPSDNEKFVTVQADVLTVRKGASTQSDPVLNSDSTIKKVNQGDKFTVLSVYNNVTLDQTWVQINTGEWIAVKHSSCENRICASFSNN
jgi:hypothetical protein